MTGGLSSLVHSASVVTDVWTTKRVGRQHSRHVIVCCFFFFKVRHQHSKANQIEGLKVFKCSWPLWVLATIDRPRLSNARPLNVWDSSDTAACAYYTFIIQDTGGKLSCPLVRNMVINACLKSLLPKPYTKKFIPEFKSPSKVRTLYASSLTVM